MSIISIAIYRFNAILIKLPMVFFTELEQIISQFVWKYKKLWVAKVILRKKNGTEESTCLTSGYTTKPQSSRHIVLAQGHKYRSMEQNRKPRDKSTNLWTPYLQQRGKNIQWKKDNLFNKWCWENWSTTCKRMKWGRLSYLSLLFFGTLHSNGYIFPFLLCFWLLFFSQLFARPPQAAILLFCISFSWGWSWSPSPVQCHKPLSIVHQALCVSDLVP